MQLPPPVLLFVALLVPLLVLLFPAGAGSSLPAQPPMRRSAAHSAAV
jgi:hypothetical protein